MTKTNGRATELHKIVFFHNMPQAAVNYNVARIAKTGSDSSESSY